MKNRHRAYHYLLLLSMPLGLGAGEARAQTIAELAQRTARPETEVSTPSSHTVPEGSHAPRAVKRTAAPISDDGNGNERLLSTSQLIISTKAPVDEPLILEILDENGRTVQRMVLSTTIRQTVWPIDLQDLQRGRYAARVRHTDGALVSRFRRE